MESAMIDLYNQGKYSDLTIKCRDRRFKVHKAVVCMRSKVLAAAVDGNFKEATTGEIDLQEDEPEIVANMIKFLYTDTYEDGNDSAATSIPAAPTIAAKMCNVGKKAQKVQSERKTSQNSTPQSSASTNASETVESAEAVLINTKVYIIGDKYDIQHLKDLAAKKYGEALPNHWNNAPFVASLKLAYEEIPDNDRPLKDLAVETAAKHVKELTDRGEFASLCKENGEIAFDVLKASHSLKMTPIPICSHCETADNVIDGHCYEYCSKCRREHDMTNPYYCRECGLHICK